MRVRGEYIAVSQFVREAKSKGGIVLPDELRTSLPLGVVCFVGPKITDLKPGEVVCFTEYAGAPIEIKGHTYRILDSDEILMVLDPNEYEDCGEEVS